MWCFPHLFVRLAATDLDRWWLQRNNPYLFMSCFCCGVWMTLSAALWWPLLSFLVPLLCVTRQEEVCLAHSRSAVVCPRLPLVICCTCEAFLEGATLTLALVPSLQFSLCFSFFLSFWQNSSIQLWQPVRGTVVIGQGMCPMLKCGGKNFSLTCNMILKK